VSATYNKLGVRENVVRAFRALLLGQNFGKMRVRERKTRLRAPDYDDAAGPTKGF
jgi:hypothetical protein